MTEKVRDELQSLCDDLTHRADRFQTCATLTRDAGSRNYFTGKAEAYHSAAQELHELLKRMEQDVV